MLNRPKGYKLLIISLFLVFISLVSRSLIYMGISISVAAAIAFLLTKDTSERRKPAMNEQKHQSQEDGKEVKKTAGNVSIIGWLFLLTGIAMAFYGGAGLFSDEHLLHRTEIMTDDLFALYTFFVLGIFASFYGLYQIIFQYLSE
ncbi:hypothetical protein SAMN05444126_1344 [Salisediminibacterium halotolerans]|uniref:Uncharacterized protein n=2 Tax=Salisediminibacterium halotolerans TaxID=517425 RepID=A0A1H9WF74_9BACI|nr:hypothetical protein SAMN05444126_1344 [Salisediminibacterium haloalkalitolerans]